MIELLAAARAMLIPADEANAALTRYYREDSRARRAATELRWANQRLARAVREAEDAIRLESETENETKMEPKMKPKCVQHNSTENRAR